MAPPIVFNKPESMLKMRLVTMRDQSESALKYLHELGALEVEESSDLTPDDIAAVEADREKVSESLRRVEGLLAYLESSESVELDRDVQDAYQRPIEQTHDEIELVYSKLERIYEKSIKLREDLKELAELQRYLVPLAEQLDVKIEDLNYTGRYLYTNIYVFAAGSAETFVSQASEDIFSTTIIPMDEEVVVYTVAKAELKKRVDMAADGLGGKALSLPEEGGALKAYVADLDGRIPKIEAELEELTTELQDNVKENLPTLALLKTVLTAEDERLSVLEMAYQAKYVNIVEGWVPEADAKDAVAQIEKGISDVYVETRKPEKSEQPPSKLKNVRGVKPFEVIVNLFSVPRYGGWDPTPIVAYFFAFFFGVMFADVIYGLLLILCVKLLLHKLVDDPTTDGFQLFKRVLYTTGVVGVIIGALSGSYLGNIYDVPLGLAAEGAPALIAAIQEWMGSPIKFLIFALIVGLVHLNVAFFISLYKGIKEGDKAEILAKAGIILVEFLIPFILINIIGSTIAFIPKGEALYWVFTVMGVIGIPLIIVGSIMKQGGLGGFFWMFDLTGLLGDVMSYARLAGVGMATYELAKAFNGVAVTMGNLFGGGVFGGIVIVVILFAAHLINLFLGVLSGFVHSLRLCFAEFLMKFYDGGGREFAPFKLKRPKSVIIGE